MTSRREFVIQLSLGSAAMLAGGQVFAQALVDEKDAQASQLGYKSDTTKVDGKKYAAHKPEQNCANCTLYQGKAGEKAGGCPLFAGKLVTATGWCQMWNIKV